ncbi:MAG: deoxyribonuclease IV [Syntrophomonadaceae bacterium]|jgi:deoxyribonuclease-4|nr:deoxyribonuclease IV [Bacillota bacterium]NLP24083.1 deoxyribonuclease IV [Syntrophomonadaceae bacterium]
MLYIGCHLSSSKGYKHMGQEALSIGANTFQFFTRNPRGSKAKKMDIQDAQALVDLTRQHGFAPIIAHAPYTLNPCAADPQVREFAHLVMGEDLANLDYLPGVLYNVHPGNHVGQGVETGIQLVAELLNTSLRPQQHTLVLLETMSGKGTEVGSSFEEIAAILDRVELQDKMGVCLDTCHIYAAGYDIVNDLEDVLESFDKTIGLSRLKAVHLNDSLNPLASRKDRHTNIGQGTIGLEAIVNFINHPRLRHLPFCLETPGDLTVYAEEIRLLKDAFQA